MSTEPPPADLLEGATVVEELDWPTIFGRICERVDQAITEMHSDLRPVPCPECRGARHSCCRWSGKAPWKSVQHDKRARLQLAIEILEHQLRQRGPEEAHWFERAITELRELLEAKYKGTE